MAGHSKWSQIKHKKAKNDAARSKQFSKLLKEIINAARIGGGDATDNPRLRLLIDKAKEINMPHDNIIRAIKRGTGELPGVTYEETRYEGYGPGGIAILVDILTDNKNKAVADLRYVFNRKGGNLAENGSVSWMFTKQGVIRVSHHDLSEERLLELLLDFALHDISHEDTLFTITCDPRFLEAINNTLKKEGYNAESAEVEWTAHNTIALSKDDEERAYELLQSLEDLDDVQNVYTNLG